MMRAKENAELKKLLDWHLRQAKSDKEQYDFHVWAATLLSLIREIR